MQTTPRLQAIITAIAAKHKLDLDKPGAYLRLELDGSGYLVIENIGAGAHWARISVTHFIAVGNDLMMDPRVVLYADYVPEKAVSRATSTPPQRSWTPIETTEILGGWTLYAEVDPHGNLVLYDPEGQAYLAEVTETVFARNLARCGWLELARRATGGVTAWTPEEIYVRDIRSEEPPVFDPYSEEYRDEEKSHDPS